jgi:hypothetical protein
MHRDVSRQRCFFASKSRLFHAKTAFRAMILGFLEVRPFEGGRDMTDRWLSLEEIDE